MKLVSKQCALNAAAIRFFKSRSGAMATGWRWSPCWATMLLLSVLPCRAAVQSVDISSRQVPAGPRWIYGIGEAPKGKGTEVILARAKKDQLEMNFKACVADARSARAKVPSVAPWLAALELDCAIKIESVKDGESEVRRTLSVIQKKPEWLLRGAHLNTLKAVYIKALLSLLERDGKANRARAWEDLDNAQEASNLMDNISRAQMWDLAGQAAFMQQNTEAARDFYHRSLVENPTDDVRAHLKSLENSVGADKKETASMKPSPLSPDARLGKAGDPSAITTTPTPGPGLGGPTPSALAVRAGSRPNGAVTNNADLEASPRELELVERATSALKSGDYGSAAQDCAKLIREFPGGTRAKWATDRIFEAYSTLADKTDSKYSLLREQLLVQMEKVDADRTAEWARLMYNRGQWEDALRLARKALRELTGARATKTMELAGDAALASDHFDVAHEMYAGLVETSAGTPSARAGLFHSALLHYREQKYPQAIAEFERLLALPQIENVELSARYWLWRSLQKNKPDHGDTRADAAADELMRKFPFSYYGLRARIDRDQGVLEWKSEDPATLRDVKSRLSMTTRDQATWSRVQLLLKAGWLDEAQAEIRDLPPAYRADDKAVRALLWSASGQAMNASRMVNEAWDENAELRRAPFTRAAFPNEFNAFVQKEAQSRKVEPVIVESLIKQESAFNVKAVSSSNAFGLMQMIAPTALDVSRELRLGHLNLPDDMFQPQRNIMMGTYYIAQLINRYQGNVPLGLASYNAGPARIDRWLKARPSLKSVMGARTGNPDDEIWFDEIPYGETNYYVKAILRNILLYRVLDQGKVEGPFGRLGFQFGIVIMEACVFNPSPL